MKIESKYLHAGYEPKNGEPRILLIYQNTAYKCDSTNFVEQLSDLTAERHMYSRISDPTVDAAEKKITALEGGIGALCTASGQSATFLALMNMLEGGDHLVASSTTYGGSVNLLSITFRRSGTEVSYVGPDAAAEEIEKPIHPDTKVVSGEIMADPAMNVLDIEKFAGVAHAHSILLFVDNTSTTPVLCQPFRFGTDIVIHGTVKYMNRHALQIGGVIVDGGTFNWANGKLPGLSTPDAFYHGIMYMNTFKEAAYITKARTQLICSLGCYSVTYSAFLLNLGLETLAVRTGRHYANTQKTAEFLEPQDAVEFINYPGLKQNKYHALAWKYLPEGCRGVISFSIKGGKERTAAFTDHLRMVSLEVHVADIRTCIPHPVSSIHRQLTDEQLANCGITPGLIQLYCGIEHIDGILEDLAQAFTQIQEMKQHVDQYTEWPTS